MRRRGVIGGASRVATSQNGGVAVAPGPAMIRVFERVLLRWGFIRLKDHGLVLGADGRVLPMGDIGHSFEPPSWSSLSLPIDIPSVPAPRALPPPVPRRIAAGTATEPVADDEEWQWKLALARAKAGEQR